MKKSIGIIKIRPHMIIYLIAMSAFIMAGCAPAKSAVQEVYVEAMPEAPVAGEAFTAKSSDFAAGSDLPEARRLVIKNANLSIVVKDPVKSMDIIADMADEMDGFVVTAHQYQSDLESGIKVTRAEITIRVPAERLNEALKRIKKESDRAPVNENIESQDVTREYTDLQSRLRNLEKAEAQLQAIMEEAYKTQDVLDVYNQLVQVREQIETIKGQVQYYEQAAALSSISVELIPNEAAQPLTIGGWQPVGVAKEAVQTLINTLKFFVNLLIWIVIYILPVLLVFYVIIILPITLVWRFWRRRRAQQKGVAKVQEPPI